MTEPGLRDAARTIRTRARKEARRAAKPVERWVIKKKTPLVLESLRDEEVLREGDEDLEIARGLRRRANVGDVVLVARDVHGDRVATHVISGGSTDENVGEGPTQEEFDAYVASTAVTLAELEVQGVGFFNVLAYGAVGEGADDGTAIRAAVDAAADAGGGVVLLPGLHGFRGELLQRQGVTLMGLTSGSGVGIQGGLLALDDTAFIHVGNWGANDMPGGMRDLKIDGGGFDFPDGLLIYECVTVNFYGVTTLNATGRRHYFKAAQNLRFFGCDDFGAADMHVYDHGAGGIKHYAGERRISAGVGIRFMESTPGDQSDNAYPFGPADIDYYGGIVETEGDAAALIYASSGVAIHFHGVGISNNEPTTLSMGGQVVLDNTDFPSLVTELHFDSCNFNGGQTAQHPAIRMIGNGTSAVITGHTTAQESTNLYLQDTGAGLLNDDSSYLFGLHVLNMYGAINGGSTLFWGRQKYQGQFLSLDDESPNALLLRRSGEAGGRWSLDRDGTMRFFDGSDFSSRASILFEPSPDRLEFNSGTVDDPILSGIGEGLGDSDAVNLGQAGAYICLRDEKASGTGGGSFTNGAWRTRTLNVEANDVGGHCALAADQFILDAGEYEIEASAPGFAVDRHAIRLQNVTAGTTLLSGRAMFASSAGFHENVAELRGRFTIAAGQELELQHRCETSDASGLGMGVQAGSAFAVATEVYAVVVLRKKK